MKTMLTFTSLALVGIMAVVSPARAQQTKDIVDTAVAAGSFTTLAKALTAADLVATLKGPGPFTVFAPTDEAFAKLPAGTLEKLLKPENKAMLRRVLTYHVVPGKVMAADVVKVSSAKAVSGDTLSIKAERRHRDGRQGAGRQDRHRRKQRRHSRRRRGPAPARRNRTIDHGRNGPAHRRQRIHRQPPSSSARGRRLRGAVPRAAARARRRATAHHRGRRGRLPRRSVGRRGHERGGPGVSTWCTRWRAVRRLPRSIARLRPTSAAPPPAPASAASSISEDSATIRDSLSTHLEEPPGNGRGTARKRRTGRRVPRVGRHWRRQPVVRDDPRAGRAAAGDALPEVGRHPHPAHCD